MARQFVIHGEVLVKVKFGQHVLIPGLGPLSSPLYELGLASESVVIDFNSNYHDIKVSDYGPNVPPDVLWQLATANIQIGLIHYDPAVLDTCIAQSMGGSSTAGVMVGAGQPLGNGLPLGASGNFYISLNLLSPQANNPWRFPAAYLAEKPLAYPMGTKLTLANTTWRAIPYPLTQHSLSTVGEGGLSPGTSFTITLPFEEVTSSGAILFDHTLDK